MTEVLLPDAAGIATAAAILRNGGLVAFPTDTVYGVGCAMSRADRVQALYALKRRPTERQIPMLVAGIDALPAGWVVDERARALAAAFWPGALTIVLPAVDGGDSQAFRAPDHPVTQALIAAAGPLLATSANLSDEPDTLDADDVLIAFATQADLLDAVVDGGRIGGAVASTVLDLSGPGPRIVRQGPVSVEMLRAVIELESPR